MLDGIVFIHAFPLDGSMWAGQVEEFGKRTKVLAPSLPGFGGAPPGGAVMTMSASAEHIAQAMHEATMSRAVVCGLSMGGYVALALWRQHPELIAGFVFANTKASADDELAKERRRQLAARLRAEGSSFLVESPPPLLSNDAPAGLLEQVTRLISAQPPEAIAAASLGMAERPDSTPDLATITVPTLVITGSKDTLIPPEATKLLADGIPGAQYEVIQGAGHLSNLQAPEQFNDLLRVHLERLG